MTQLNDPTVGLAGLFDLSFTRFITISFIRVIYLLGMTVIGLSWAAFNLIALLGAFRGGASGLAIFVVMFVVSVLVALLYLVFLRVALEVVVVIFRIGENTSAIAAHQGASPPTGGFPVMPIDA